MLSDAAVGSRRSQLGFGIRARGAPRAFGAGLHDRTGGGSDGADVDRLPQLAHQAVHPALQLRARQARVPLRLLHVRQADGDVEDRVQTVKTLLHVAVLQRPVVKL